MGKEGEEEGEVQHPWELQDAPCTTLVAKEEIGCESDNLEDTCASIYGCKLQVVKIHNVPYQFTMAVTMLFKQAQTDPDHVE